MQAYRLLDRGPPAESERACVAFRKLWGDHAELRRLPDASIHEAVAWDSVPPHHHCAIPDFIIKHIFEKHLPGCKVCCRCARSVAERPEASRRPGQQVSIATTLTSHLYDVLAFCNRKGRKRAKNPRKDNQLKA